jgi:hypothetical protein
LKGEKTLSNTRYSTIASPDTAHDSGVLYRYYALVVFLFPRLFAAMQNNQTRYNDSQRYHHTKPIDQQDIHNRLLLVEFKNNYSTDKKQGGCGYPKQKQRRRIDIGPKQNAENHAAKNEFSHVEKCLPDVFPHHTWFPIVVHNFDYRQNPGVSVTFLECRDVIVPKVRHLFWGWVTVCGVMRYSLIIVNWSLLIDKIAGCLE